MKTKLWLIVLAFISVPAFGQKSKSTPETALKDYMGNGDKSFQWELKDSTALGSVMAYHLLLTSQKWHDITWRHQLTVFVPKDRKYEDALFFITGGSNKEEQPNWSNKDGLWPALSAFAAKNKSIVALIKQVPNQPIFDGRTEDEIISYTLHKYKEDKDVTWPLLFPMVKSAVRGMDAVQEFVKKKTEFSVNNFVVTGASKRGWTTWLSAAIDDKRVKAIAPMVIDMLNMPATLNYQYTTYGEYSIEIEDYVKLGIPQGTGTPDGKAITSMIDPFSYRAKYNIPKMIFIGTNDPYWTVDATKHYYNEIPNKNLIHYVPNAGHDLAGGKQALEALSGFFANVVQNRDLPLPVWEIKSNKTAAELSVKALSQDFVEATLWYTTSSDRDFRNNLWLSERVKISDLSNIKIEQSYPKKGYSAFYLDLKYKDPSGGNYSTATRIYVLDSGKVL